MTPAPAERHGITRRMVLQGSEGELKTYATINFEDGRPVELILRASKKGTLERGLLHCLGLVVTIALQHGVPARTLTSALKGVTFEPTGMTGAKDIPMVKSIADFLARWMEAQEIANG